MESGQYDLAIAEYTDAIRLDPGCAMAYCGCGVAFAKKRQFHQAIAQYVEAIRLDPAYAAAFRNRGRDYFSLGKHRRAVADFTEAIRLEPKSGLAYIDRSMAYGGWGKERLAMADAQAAVRLAPQHYLAWATRGYRFLNQAGARIFTFWRRGNSAARKADYVQAIADFTQALQLNPTAWDCYAGRARAHRALGDSASAASDELRVRERR